MSDAVHIVAAKRTPIGRLNGALSGRTAVELGAVVVRQVVAQCGVDPASIDEVIMGQVLTAGAGQNPARQTALAAHLPESVPAFTVNKVCGSGLKAIHLAAQAIAGGDAHIVVAGGQESMSRAPHLVGVRQAPKAGDLSLADSAMADGLVDAVHHVPMGATAEHLATTLRIPRARQDEFALRSHHRAVDALERLQSEIVAVRTSSGEVSCDEQPRADTSLAALGKLKPAFVADGTVTAGNAASLNDGSAAVVLAAESEVVALGLTSLGRIVCCATSALAPMDMGLGAATAASAALIKSGWSVEDVDLIEINEAFAVQTLAVIDRLDCDPDRVNVNGGAIALGHPIGASGARVLVTLLYEMTRRGAKRGLATLCIGGGQGIAICIEAS